MATRSEEAPTGPALLAPDGGAQFSHSVSKWNHSASFMRSPAVEEAVGVGAAVSSMPDEWVEGPKIGLPLPLLLLLLLPESWLVSMSGLGAFGFGILGGAVGVKGKKLAMGSTEELLDEPVGVLGTGSASGKGTGGPNGLLPTTT